MPGSRCLARLMARVGIEGRRGEGPVVEPEQGTGPITRTDVGVRTGGVTRREPRGLRTLLGKAPSARSAGDILESDWSGCAKHGETFVLDLDVDGVATGRLVRRQANMIGGRMTA